MARHFCALVLVLGFAPTAVTLAGFDAGPARALGTRAAVERVGVPTPGPGHSPVKGCGKTAVPAPDHQGDVSARIAAAALRVLQQVSELPAMWLDQRGLDRMWNDEMKAALEDLRLSVVEAYRQVYDRVTRVGGVG